jgi:hypothetical protein
MPRRFLFMLPLVAATALAAADTPPEMMAYVDSDVRNWVNDPRVVEAIVAQNARTEGLSQAQITASDTEWQAQVGTSSTPLIDEVMSAPLSDFLREKVADSQGRITEIFVMDGRGLNVAASTVTSDYWQGDEAKFSESYGKGPGAVFFDEISLDESTQTYQGQVSFAVSDPSTGEVIGAVTLGLDAAAFF